MLCDGEWVDLADSDVDVTIGPWSTIFHDLAHAECVAHIGDISTRDRLWSRAMLAGAKRLEPTVSWEEIRLRPSAIAESVIEEINSAISSRSRKHQLFSWSYVAMGYRAW